MKVFVKEVIFTNYKWGKKGKNKDKLVGVKGSEQLVSLVYTKCDLCGKESAKIAEGFAGFTPRGWSVLTTVTPDPLGDDETRDLCESCTEENT